jgi:8-oxo-dGTP pyrophosphatase MutT (NUDIX family)
MSVLKNNDKMVHQFVASGFIVTPDRSATLLIWHRKLKKWLQPGGHLDEGELPHEGALREVSEEVGLAPRIVETGVQLGMSPSNQEELQVPTPYTVFREVIPETPKEAEHIHIDLLFVMEHERVQPQVLSERELAKAGWFTREEVEQLDTFESVRMLAGQLLV